MARQLALVTGASSGLGSAIVRDLAGRGYDVALTARSAPPMDALAAEINAAHGVEASVHPCDLSRPGGVATLVDQLDAAGIAPDILVNNAGFGLAGRFLDHDPERLRAMLQLNVVAVTELAHAVGGRMAQRGSGRILLVASLAAFQPNPLLAAYGATKAHILSLGEALAVELAPTVGVTVLSPGLMHTNFNAVSGFEPPAGLRRFILPTEAVARIGIDALLAGRSSVVAGRMNAALAWSTRLVSHRMAAVGAYRMSGGR